MSNIELISLISSITSLILALVAIYLALHHKKESDLVNEATKRLLLDVHSDAKTLSAVAMPELKAYGETMRKFVFKEETKEGENKFIELFNDIRFEINDLKKTNNLSEAVEQKILDLEKTLNEKQESTKNFRTERKGYFTIHVDTDKENIVSTPVRQFENVQDLLDMIWLSFLSDIVPPFTYGETWEIINSVDGAKLQSKGESDVRSLAQVGITENSNLFVNIT